MSDQKELQAVFEKYAAQISDSNPVVSFEGQKALAAAMTNPIREAVFAGEIYSDIFTRETIKSGGTKEYHMDLVVPGSEGDYVAYSMPDVGQIPYRHVTSDRVMVNTYRIANSIDTPLRLIRTADFDVVARMMQVLEAGFVQKLNDDAWSVVISAGNARGLMINDGDAAQGQFTPRLVTLLKTVMRRNGGGNSTSTNRGKLTRLYVSPESKDDIRSWGLDLVSDAIRTQIYNSTDGSQTLKVYDVEVRDIDELGVGQKYQTYFTSTLAGSLAASDVELVIGLDETHNTFVMPVSQDLEVREDATLHRSGRFGVYGSQEQGFACLDTRSVVLGSL